MDSFAPKTTPPVASATAGTLKTVGSSDGALLWIAAEIVR